MTQRTLNWLPGHGTPPLIQARRITGIRCRWLGLTLALCVCMAGHAAERWDALVLPDFQVIEHNGRPLDGPIRAITQDQQGFIWITADAALWRWDGYKLKKAGFVDIADDSPELPEILTAKIDPDGVIWVGTSAGLFRLDQGRLTLQRVDAGVLDTESPEFLAFDYSGGGKRLYLASGNALFVWSNGSARKVHAGEPDDRIHTILATDGGRLWIGSNDGLLYMDRDHAPQAVAGLAHKRISALYQAIDKDLWIGTAKDGLFRIDSDSQLHTMPFPKSGETAAWIYDINEARAGEFWLATFGNGILVYDARSGAFKPIRKERMLESKLLDNDIWTLFRDRVGSLWIGTRTGVNVTNTAHSGLRHIPAGLPGMRLSDGLIYAMESLPDGRVAVGTGNYGLDILHPQDGLVRHLPPGSQLGNTRIPDNAIEAMLATRDNQLLLGSTWSTLRYDLITEQAEALATEGRPPDQYTCDIVLFGGSLWLAGTDGLWRVDDGKAVNVLLGTLGERRVTRLLADGDTLWIGTWKGLKRLNIADGVNPKISVVHDSILDQKYINALHKDPQGRLWIGTYGGGLLYNQSDRAIAGKTWSHLGDQEGLPGNKVAGILSDDDGNLWVGTENGLARIDSRSLTVNAIRQEAGASAAPYETAVRTVDGDLLFGGSNGITVVQPRQWQRVDSQAALVFSEIRAGNGLPMPAQYGNKGQITSLSVPAAVDTVELEFAALDFINAPHLHYRYRLHGGDGGWRPVETDLRTVVLSNLDPRDYRLEIGYSQDGENWSNTTLMLPISVKPEWHEKTWVRGLLAVLLLALLLALHRWWSIRARRRQAALEVTVLERTAALKKANDMLQQQAQTIREASLTDPLTGMHNRRFFSQRIEGEAQLAVRWYKTGSDVPIEQADLLFFLVDIDEFKRINDRHGHAAGDAVLVEMRQRLQTVFRGSDFLIRWGGEEFLAVARGASRSKSGELAERIRVAVNGSPFQFNGNAPIHVACSIGFAPYPFMCGRPEALSWKETLALADAALYAAKNAGRNAWVGFNGRDEPMGNLISILRASPEAAVQAESIGVSRSTGDGQS